MVVLTIEEDPREVFEALEAVASGYLVKLKSLTKVLEAFPDVLAGGTPMSSSIARLVVQTFNEHGHSKRQTSNVSSL